MKKEEEIKFSGCRLEEKIGHNMRFKCYEVIDNDTLYWVTQDEFDKEDVNKFIKEVKKQHNFTKFLILIRDDSCYDFKTDLEAVKIDNISYFAYTNI